MSNYPLTNTEHGCQPQNTRNLIVYLLTGQSIFQGNTLYQLPSPQPYLSKVLESLQLKLLIHIPPMDDLLIQGYLRLIIPKQDTPPLLHTIRLMQLSHPIQKYISRTCRHQPQEHCRSLQLPAAVIHWNRHMHRWCPSLIIIHIQAVTVILKVLRNTTNTSSRSSNVQLRSIHHSVCHRIQNQDQHLLSQIHI